MAGLGTEDAPPQDVAEPDSEPEVGGPVFVQQLQQQQQPSLNDDDAEQVRLLSLLHANRT